MARDESASIIVCFDRKWQERLASKNISVVFRKQGPKAFRPDWMYAYMATPISAVTAKMRIIQCDSMPLDEAVQLAPDGGLTEAELRAYAAPPFAARWSELTVYSIAQIGLAESPVTMKQMREAWGYWPSSTFTRLSEEARRMIEEQGRFQ